MIACDVICVVGYQDIIISFLKWTYVRKETKQTICATFTSWELAMENPSVADVFLTTIIDGVQLPCLLPRFKCPKPSNVFESATKPSAFAQREGAEGTVYLYTTN